MKVGLDSYSLHPLERDEVGRLAYCRDHGFAGLQAGNLRRTSPGLDPGPLKAFRDAADAMGLYTEVSVGPINPHGAGRRPDEIVEGLPAQIESAAACGWNELHAALGGPRERYELATPWPRQLADCTDILRRVAPVLRHHGCRINLETHGDTTTWELVRLCEAVGPDCIGICLDTANVLLFGEHPTDAARRAAPYTHMTHAKDAILYFTDEGLTRQGRPPGRGCVDWNAILPILAAHAPDLTLSIEDHKMVFTAPIFDADWLAQQPDLTRDELARTVALAWSVHRRIIAGEIPDPDQYERIPFADEMDERLAFGRDYLNGLIRDLAPNTQG